MNDKLTMTVARNYGLRCFSMIVIIFLLVKHIMVERGFRLL